MRHREKTGAQVQEIRTSEVTRKVSIGDREVLVRLQDAMTGIVDGKRVLLDEVLIDSMVEKMVQSIRQNHSRYNPIPEEIILRNSSHQEQEKDGKEKPQEAEIMESCEPRFALKQVAMKESVREQIQTAIAAVRHRKKMSEEWGMSEYFAANRAVILNFYGKPGTGKSMAAEAVAEALGKRVYRINYSELESKYVGETPKNIRKAFACAARDDAVLIFDEADSFLGKRLSSVTQSADYGVNITRSVLLMELEKFSGVVVFTTNLVSNYDEAFKRRILLSIYFEMPDEAARTEIWKLHLNGKMPLKVSAETLAGRYDGISGADIKDMVFYAALYAMEKDRDMDASVFDYAYEAVRSRYRNLDAEGQMKVVSKEIITEEEYQKEIGRQGDSHA